MILAAPPPPTIVAAVKTVYPGSAISVTKVCRVEPLAFVRLRVRGRDHFVALRHVRRGWRVVWINGHMTRSVAPAQRATISAAVARLRTRCLAP